MLLWFERLVVDIRTCPTLAQFKLDLYVDRVFAACMTLFIVDTQPLSFYESLLKRYTVSELVQSRYNVEDVITSVLIVHMQCPSSS